MRMYKKQYGPSSLSMRHPREGYTLRYIQATYAINDARSACIQKQSGQSMVLQQSVESSQHVNHR